MGRTQLFVWFSKFPNVTSVEDVECLGQPLMRKTDENVDQESWPQKQRNHYMCSCKNADHIISVSSKEFKKHIDLCQIASKSLSSTCPLCLSLCKFLAKSKISLIPHPSSSPHLAPCDLFLFQKLKLVLKVRRFNTVPRIPAMHLLSFEQCTS